MQRFGLRLLPDLHEAYNPMPYQAAVDMEIELGIGFRGVGFGRIEERRGPGAMWALTTFFKSARSGARWPLAWFKRA